MYCPACGGTRAVRGAAAPGSDTVVSMQSYCFIWSRYGFMVPWRISGGENSSQNYPNLQTGIVDACIWGLYCSCGHAVIRNIAVYQFGYDYLGDLLR